jgi:hypothetical protein
VSLIEYTPKPPAGIGWVYDEATGKFSVPAQDLDVSSPIASE